MARQPEENLARNKLAGKSSTGMLAVKPRKSENGKHGWKGFENVRLS